MRAVFVMVSESVADVHLAVMKRAENFDCVCDSQFESYQLPVDNFQLPITSWTTVSADAESGQKCLANFSYNEEMAK